MLLRQTLQRSRAWRTVTKAGSGQNPITVIAGRLEPAARKRFLAAVKILDTSDTEALIAAIRGRDADAIATLLHVPDLGKALAPLLGVLKQAYGLSGISGAHELAQQLEVSFAFNLTSPNAINWAHLHGAQLVTRITDQARATIREVVGQGLQQGIAPVEQARIIRDVVPLTDRQAMAVMNYRFDLLEAGRTPEDVNRLGTRYAQQLLNYRAKTIARTETIDASNKGLLESWNQAADKGLIDRETTQRIWQTADDERVCPICSPMDGLTVALTGEQFETGDGEYVNAPPAHPACRCSQGLVL